MEEKEALVNNFYAILEDNVVRKINLLQDISASIKSIFSTAGEHLLNNDSEEIQFDGNHYPDNDEVLFVLMELPENLKEVATNSIGIQALDLKNESIKSLFWFENDVYYFQNFDKRKLLTNKNVILYDNQTYSKLQQDAFIIDNVVNAIFKNGKFYFTSYANANRIFSLINYFQEATNEEIKSFSTNPKILVDEKWFTENSSSIIRKHVALLQKSKILDTADTKKIKSSAKKFKLLIELDEMGKIIFPQERKRCKDILYFLNEQYYIGLISGNKYKTSSKREA